MAAALVERSVCLCASPYNSTVNQNRANKLGTTVYIGSSTCAFVFGVKRSKVDVTWSAISNEEDGCRH